MDLMFYKTIREEIESIQDLMAREFFEKDDHEQFTDLVSWLKQYDTEKYMTAWDDDLHRQLILDNMIIVDYMQF